MADREWTLSKPTVGPAIQCVLLFLLQSCLQPPPGARQSLLPLTAVMSSSSPSGSDYSSREQQRLTGPPLGCSTTGGGGDGSSLGGGHQRYRSHTDACPSTTCSSHLSSGSGSGSTSSVEGTGSGNGNDQMGYDYDFLSAVDEKYECPICCFVLRNPNQTKCGHRFCSNCIRKWIQEDTNPQCVSRCPICADPLSTSDLFSDNFAKREILSLQIYCPNRKQGCDVTVELRHATAHTMTCDFASLPCPSGCSVALLRKNIENHLKHECQRRIIQCDVCMEEITYDSREQHLETECPSVEVKCEMCSASITRQQLKSHNSETCPKMLVECAFNKLGCTTKIERDQLDTHLHLSTQAHLKMLAETVENLKGFLHESSSGIPFRTDLHSIQARGGLPSSDPSGGPFSDPLTLTSMQMGSGRTGSSGFRHVSISTADSGVMSGVSKYTTTSISRPGGGFTSGGGGGGGGVTMPTHFYKETMMHAGSGNLSPIGPMVVSASDRLDSLSLQIPTGYSDPSSIRQGHPSLLDSSEAQGLSTMSGRDLGSLGSRPRHHRGLVRQTSLPGQDKSSSSLRGSSTTNAHLSQHTFNTSEMSGTTSPTVSLQLQMEPVMEQMAQQEARLDQQLMQINTLRTHNDSLKQTLEEQRRSMITLEERVRDLTLRNCSGTFIWKVQNYYHKKMEAQRGTRTVIHSDGFYSSLYGYKLCVRLNLNGVESAIGTHVSLFVHFMQGEYDDILDWPFSGRISLAILDQTEMTQYRQHITETLLSKPNLAAFQRPITHRNHKGFGYVEFSPLSLIEGKNPCYVKNDTVYIKVKVE